MKYEKLARVIVEAILERTSDKLAELARASLESQKPRRLVYSRAGLIKHEHADECREKRLSFSERARYLSAGSQSIRVRAGLTKPEASAAGNWVARRRSPINDEI